MQTSVLDDVEWVSFWFHDGERKMKYDYLLVGIVVVTLAVLTF